MARSSNSLRPRRRTSGRAGFVHAAAIAAAVMLFGAIAATVAMLVPLA